MVIAGSNMLRKPPIGISCGLALFREGAEEIVHRVLIDINTVKVRPSAASLIILSHLTTLLNPSLPTGRFFVGDQPSSLSCRLGYRPYISCRRAFSLFHYVFAVVEFCRHHIYV